MRCVIIGSAPVSDPKILNERIRPDDFILCADGGAAAARRMGLRPDLMIGDFDSYSGDFPAGVETIRLPVQKDDTDLMYSVKEALRRGFTEFLLLGVTGGRLDHTLGSISALQYLSEEGAHGVLADEKNEVLFFGEGSFTVKGKRGALLSVFPWGTPFCNVTYEQLEYPLDHQSLYSREPTGVSNCMLADEVRIHVHRGPVLVVLSQD